MKRSIVLLITLALIVTISSLLIVGLKAVDRLGKEVEQKRALLQKAIFLQNTVDILKKQDLNTSQDLDLLLWLPIDLASHDIEVKIAFESAAYGVNPNNFLKKEHNKELIDPDYVLLFDRILQFYNVQNKEFFIAMIEDTLDKDLQERIPGSELALYNKRFLQGKIENKKKFDMLIDAYIKRTEDANIKNVPWDRLVTFYNRQIDINRISPDLLRFLLPYSDESVIEKLTKERSRLYKSVEDLPLAKELKDALKKYDLAGFVGIVKGHLTMKKGTFESQASFIYDIQQKKVMDIAIF